MQGEAFKKVGRELKNTEINWPTSEKKIINACMTIQN